MKRRNSTRAAGVVRIAGAALALLALNAAGVAAEGQKDQGASVPSGFNQTGFPIMKEAVTLKLTGLERPDRKVEENLFYKRMAAKTNINFEYSVYDANAWPEKKNLIFASGDLPDVFFKAGFSSLEEMKFGEQGLLIPLEGLIQKNTPSFAAIMKADPSVAKAITLPSGKIVALPMIMRPDGQTHMPFNIKWLEKVGMAMPKTTEDLYKVLKAFKEQDANGNGDPNDEVPLSLTNAGQVKIVLAWWGLLFNEVNVFVNDAGKVLYSPAQNEYKEGLKFMARLYAEGLLEKNIFTITPQQQNAVGQNNQLGAFITAGAFLQVTEKYHFDYRGLEPFPYNGKRLWILGVPKVSRGTFSISNKSKHADALMRWVDFLYTEEGGRLVWAGIEGEEYKFNPDGTWDWLLKPGQQQNDLRVPRTIQGYAQVPGIRPDDFWAKINNKYEGSLGEMRGPSNNHARLPFPLVYFDAEAQKKLNTYHSDLGRYVDEFMAKAIVGAVDIDKEWPAYVATLERMGMKDVVDIYQKKYADYTK